jgi:hypothetical protein
VSRDALLYVADIVAAGDAILRHIGGQTFERFAANDENARPWSVRYLSSARRRRVYPVRQRLAAVITGRWSRVSRKSLMRE